VILERLDVGVEELYRRTGWKLKPEGACKGDVCVPAPGAGLEGGRVDVHTLAELLRMPLVRDDEHDLWAVGPEALGGRTLTTAQAPDLVLPDLEGRPFALSSLRGQKVVVVAWASWCGCRRDLLVWQALRDQLHPKSLEVVTVALDVEPEDARPWIEAAKPEHPSLIDSGHLVDELLGVVNVPNSVWIDEEGMLVRPVELAQVQDPRHNPTPILEDLPPERRAVVELVEGLPRQHETYVEALHDWVEHGAASRWALSPDEVVRRSQPRGRDAAEAAAHFELGEHLHRLGHVEAAQRHWRQAHQLAPDNWTYKRQAWHLVAPGSQGPNDVYDGSWIEDVRAIGPENYYPSLLP
jgi:peroxiredoxin